MGKSVFLLISLICLLCSCTSDRAEKTIQSNDDEGLVCTFDLISPQNNGAPKPGSVIVDYPRWKIGDTIKIKFLDGTSAEHEIVKKYASEWTKYANLKFEFVPKEEDTHLRIAFENDDRGGGAWSDLGAQLLLPKSVYANYQNTPSMRLGPIDDSESSRRTILHEFGHALGLKHEMTNPNAPIKWNLSKVYNYYYDLMGLSKEEVDKDIINKPLVDDYSEYDPLSIMHYYVPGYLTLDGVAVARQSVLSEMDKKSINEWYPFPIVSVMECGQNFDDLRWKDRIQSSNKRYSLEFTPGFLQIIDLLEKKIIWSVGNNNYRRKAFCYFESNGNITLRGARNPISSVETIWSSNTSQYPGATLHLQDDGNLQLIYEGVVKWSSKTGKI